MQVIVRLRDFWRQIWWPNMASFASSSCVRALSRPPTYLLITAAAWRTSQYVEGASKDDGVGARVLNRTEARFGVQQKPAQDKRGKGVAFSGTPGANGGGGWYNFLIMYYSEYQRYLCRYMKTKAKTASTISKTLSIMPEVCKAHA